MVPYGDDVRGPKVAWATPLLITIMTAIYAAELFKYIDPENTVQMFALYPSGLLASPFSKSYRLVTSTFLHASISHLVFNMFYFYAFGRTIERFFGSWLFLLLFPLMSIPGDLLDVALRHDSDVPSLGASGSISTVMGLYLSLAHWARIKTYFGTYWTLVGIKTIRFNMPSWTILIYFIVMQILLVSFSKDEETAYDVHITCFVFGVIVGEILKRASNRIQDNIDAIIVYSNDVWNY